jgi:hypothetical protein
MVQRVACIAFAVNKDNLCMGMNKEQSNQFTACIACSADDADPDLVVHVMKFNLFCSRFALRSK